MNQHEQAIGQFFRWAGVLALVAAGVAFLVEGWSDPNLLIRQLGWAGITLALVTSGILSARRFRDPRGARVCLGLAAATVPLHFAQLGSSVLELRRHGGAMLSEVVLSAGLVLVVLPALALGGAALVRRWVRPAVSLLVTFSVPLLVPTRAADTIAIVGFAELGALVALEIFVLSRRSDLNGMDGVAVRALLVLPLLILLGRNALHEVTPLWTSALLAVPAFALLLGSRCFAERAYFRLSAQLMGGVLLAVAGCVATVGWEAVPVALAGAFLVAMALSVPSLRVGAAGWCGTISLLWAMLQAILDAHVLLTSCGLAVSIGYVVFAYQRRALVWCICNVACTFGLVAALLFAHVRFPVYFGWLVPAIFGLLLLGLGSSLQSPASLAHRLGTALSRRFLDND